MINLYLLELQDPELAQELRENFLKNIKNKFDNYSKCSSLKTDIGYTKDLIKNLTRHLEDGLSPRYKKELEERKKDLAKSEAMYNKMCIKQEHQVLEAGFERKPHGWTDKSIKKAGTTLARHVGEKTPNDKGFFDKCVAKIGNKMKNPEGYCASLKDEASGSTYWRGKDKTKKEVQKDIAKHKNV